MPQVIAKDRKISSGAITKTKEVFIFFIKNITVKHTRKTWTMHSLLYSYVKQGVCEATSHCPAKDSAMVLVGF